MRISRAGTRALIAVATAASIVVCASAHASTTSSSAIDSGEWFDTGAQQRWSPDVPPNNDINDDFDVTIDGQSMTLATADATVNRVSLANIALLTINSSRTLTTVASPGINDDGTGEIDLSGHLITSSGGVSMNTLRMFGGTVTASNGISIIGRLDGDGTLNGDVLMDASLLSPGSPNSPFVTGQLNVNGNLTLDSTNGSPFLRIKALGASDYDKIDVTGTATLDGFFVMVYNDAAITGGYQEFEILHAASILTAPGSDFVDGTVGTTSSLDSPGDTTDYVMSLRNNLDGSQSLVVVVPEPTCAGLIGIAGAALLRRPRR